jgi:hypothetical protein
MHLVFERREGMTDERRGRQADHAMEKHAIRRARRELTVSAPFPAKDVPAWPFICSEACPLNCRP